MKQIIVNWTGPTVLLIAYSLLSGRLISSGYIYQAMNILGSSVIIMSLWSDRKNRLSLIVFNLFWIGVAIIGIAKLVVTSATFFRN